MSHPIALKSCAASWPLSGFADEAGPTTDEQVAAVRRAGLSHIDLRGIDGFNISALPLDHARAIRAKLDAAGITVAMFGSPIGKIDIADDFRIDADKLDHLGQLAPILGCHAVRIFSYYNKGGRPLAAWRAESLSRLKRLRDAAAKKKLVLYHENESHIFGDTSEHVAIIGGELRDGPNGTFRLIYDFDNYNRTGKDAWSIWLEQRDRIDAFHLKDSDAQGQHVLIGQGIGKAREILADALARGWHGPVSLEPHLQHSAAVMATVAATGMDAKANQKFSDMTPADCYHAAAEEARKLLTQLGAPLA